ncbi:MAG: RNA methyltransferase, partial [Pirellulales bacterium]
SIASGVCSAMPRFEVTSLDDPRLEPFRSLKDTNRTRWQSLFVAEGEKLVQRLLESDFPVVSVLADRQHEERLASWLRPELDLLIVDDPLVSAIVGFNFHRGVLACGRRKLHPTLDQIAAPLDRRLTLVVCPDVQDPENLGTIARTSLALGVDALLLGPNCGDAFSRRVLRVSMGAVLRLPIRRCEDLSAELCELRTRWQLQLAATVLDPRAEPLTEFERPLRFALLLGNEGHGLDADVVAACDRRLTIPMPAGADSLNVSVAAGIFLYQLARRNG